MQLHWQTRGHTHRLLATTLWLAGQLASWPAAAQAELFTSADELSKWSQAAREFPATLDQLIEQHEWRLESLKRVRQGSGALEKLGDDLLAGGGGGDDEAHDQSRPQINATTALWNPVNAFVLINRMSRAIESVEDILMGVRPDEAWRERLTAALTNGEQEAIRASSSAMGAYRASRRSALSRLVQEDLEGAGQALLRLQAFYELQLADMVRGVIAPRKAGEPEAGQQASFNATSKLQMDAWSCYELGLIAYHEASYTSTIQWLHKALELIRERQTAAAADEDEEEDEEEELEFVIAQIFDHMAFAAYKLKQYDYAANLTRAWLAREPQHERALENLYYYEQLLEGRGELDLAEGDLNLKADFNSDSSPNLREADSHQDLEEDARGETDLSMSDGLDESVRRLCAAAVREQPAARRPLKCVLASHLAPTGLAARFGPAGALAPLKWEQLHDEPPVWRLHELVTAREAERMRQLAAPHLKRSTVNSERGLKRTGYRIAKTAWLTNEADALVARIERRLAVALALSMEGAEPFQVNNYGLGGFYGPHMDPVRPEGTSARDYAADEKSAHPSEDRFLHALQRNDRLATVLIYLNRVEAGGATALPALNLSVAPVERSAVVWFNLLADGQPDSRLLHTGCPVLLGSKWIATKWPRERPSCQARACSRRAAHPRND